MINGSSRVTKPSPSAVCEAIDGNTTLFLATVFKLDTNLECRFNLGIIRVCYPVSSSLQIKTGYSTLT